MDITTLCNIALDEIKARATITSVFPPDGSLASTVANRQYQLRIDALSRSAHWNCLRFQQALTLLKAAQGLPENPSGTLLPLPPQPWFYEYAIPSNPKMLKARYIAPIIPQPNINPPLTTAGGIVIPPYIPNQMVPFVVSSDVDASGNQIAVILTNLSQAQLIYTSRVVDPDLWDALFTTAATAVLAQYFCLPVSGDKDLMLKNVAISQQSINQARITDGNEGPIKTDHIPDWLTARMMTGGVGVGGYNQAGWDSFACANGDIV